ncbi:hypothetical protein AB4Y45_32195 [Paraburkholderia sp. EG287A]|uniref:hypothetical protein n=1 Tax=Paraburkholderia sp. EG287A TaxID=3237012 RepID=UPI0034D36E9B
MKCSLSNLLFGALYGMRKLGITIVCVLAAFGAFFGTLLVCLEATGNASAVHIDRVTCAFGIPMGASLLGVVVYGLCRNWRKTVRAWAEVFAMLGAFFSAMLYLAWVSKTIPGGPFSVFHVANMTVARRFELLPAQIAVALLCLCGAAMVVAMAVGAVHEMCELGAKQRAARESHNASAAA